MPSMASHIAPLTTGLESCVPVQPIPESDAVNIEHTAIPSQIETTVVPTTPPERDLILLSDTTAVVQEQAPSEQAEPETTRQAKTGTKSDNCISMTM